MAEGQAEVDARRFLLVGVSWILGVAPLLSVERPFGFEPSRFEWLTLLLVPLVAMGVIVVKPRRWLPVELAAMVVISWVGNLPFGARTAIAAMVPISLWVVVLGAACVDRQREVRRALVVPLTLAVVADLFIVLRGWPNRSAPLFAIAGVLGAAIVVLPSVSGPLSRLAHIVTAPIEAMHHRLTSVAWVRRISTSIVSASRGVSGAVGGSAIATGRWFAAPVARGDRTADAPTGVPPDDVGTVRAGWKAALHEYRWPVLAWLAVYYVESKVLLLAVAVSARDAYNWFVWIMPSFTDPTGKVGWGTGDYWVIADGGYLPGRALEAAFPGLAVLMRAVSHITGRLDSAGVLIIVVSGLAATSLLWRWMIMRDVPRRERKVATLIFMLYPYSFLISGIAYSDILLVALLLGVFVLVDSDRPILAGCVAAAATFTRPNALPIIAGLVVIQLVRSDVVRMPAWRTPLTPPVPSLAAAGQAASVEGDPADDPEHGSRSVLRRVAGTRLSFERFSPTQFGVLLSVVGVASYSIWLYRRTGDPLFFLTAQGHYGHRPVTEAAAWFKSDFINSPSQFNANWAEAANEALAALSMFAAVALMPAVKRFFGWGYTVFATGVLLISWVGPLSVAPAGRYLLPVLPLAAIVSARWLAPRPRILWPLLVSFAAVSAVFLVLFTRGGELWVEW